MSDATRVYLEVGEKWTFACTPDWPGWCRRGRGIPAALDELVRYVPRYAAVAGPGFDPGEIEVIGEVAGNATTDFGAPAMTGEWDEPALDGAEAQRLTELLRRTWQVFDDVVARAPAQLAKGPRGAGRDRDKIVDHVREAERSYGRKLGERVAPGTPWAEQRSVFLAAFQAGDAGGAWPARYALRRVAWHVMDHAWEIEDRIP